MNYDEMLARVQASSRRPREQAAALDADVRRNLEDNWQQESAVAASNLQQRAMDAMRNNGQVPLPSHPANAPIAVAPSGVRSGEERVPVADSLAGLSPRGRSEMQRLHRESGTAAPFEDWVYDKYGKMEPEQRRLAMNSDALAADRKAYEDRQLARKIVRDNARGPQDQRWDASARQSLLGSAPAGPMDKLRQLQWEQRAMREASQWERVADNNRNRAMTAAMNNPNVARGLFAASLQNAATPMQAAGVHAAFGNERLAGNAMDLEGRRLEANAATDAANAANRPPESKTIAGQLGPEYAEALAMPDEAQRLDALRTIVRKKDQNMTEQEADARAREINLSHLAQTDPAHQTVQNHLNQYRNDRDRYVSEARRLMPNLTREQAELMYSNAGGMGFWPAVGQGLANMATGWFYRR